MVWSCSRPLVYQAISTLEERGLVERSGTQESAVGPARTLVKVTPAGRRALSRWLATPVGHLRDVRSELMVKLLVHVRLRRDPSRLIERQRKVFAELVESLDTRLDAAEGFDRTLDRKSTRLNSSHL